MTDFKKQMAKMWEQFGTAKCKKRELQVAALPFAMLEGELKILLLTSRATGRWVLPKGWPQKGRNEPESAEREAFEEGGVKGRIYSQACGTYRYTKVPEGIDCLVKVFPLEVKNLAEKFPEEGERKLQWFPFEEAAKMVAEKDLGELLAAFGKKAARSIAA